MRDLHVAHLDEARPVVILTRDPVREVMTRVTVAPITSTVKGLSSEVPVGRRNGLDHEGAISCDNILTVDKSLIGRHIGVLFDDQEAALANAIARAFALRFG
jgi:mRNA interferase MazF